MRNREWKMRPRAVQSPKVPLTDDQARLQATLLDNVKAAIIATDITGTITYWNPFAEELYGWSFQEVAGRNIMEVTVSAQTEAPATEIMSTLTAGSSWAGEFEVRRKNGTTFTAFINLSPITDERSVLIGVVGVSQDLTERKQAEEAVRRSEELFRTLANSLPNLCWMAHPDGYIFWYNQRFYDYTGTTPDQITGWGWQCLHDPEMLPSILACWRTSLETGQPFEMEFPLRGADGTFRWFLTRIRPLQDSQGKIVRWFGSNIDIQEQREIQQALSEAQQELEKRVQARTAELNSAAESLRELSGRLLQIQDDERRRIARELHDSAGQLLAALSMNINTVRAESHKLSSAAAAAVSENAAIVEEITKQIRTISYLLHPPLLDEVGLASALSWYIKGFSERSKIEVSLELPHDFGRLSKEKEISIFRIVQECLTNIHRHSESTTAAIRFIQYDDRIQVEIKDAGKGIPVERMRALSAASGSGVGFRGMRERLRQVGGTLEVKSTSSGTVVTATLPDRSQTPTARSR
jgi:PAS domain S-box-containing protein